jgi:hypothetical protein
MIPEVERKLQERNSEKGKKIAYDINMESIHQSGDDFYARERTDASADETKKGTES